MAMKTRRVALVCMTPVTDAHELGNMELPSYGIRRILATLMAAPELQGIRVALIDAGRPDVDAYVEAILALEPDLVGFSIYVWSTPCLVEVARRIKRARPDCTIVFGGPSARTALFDLPPYASPHTYLDALVSTEGEATFREIAGLPHLSRAALESVPGLHLPGPQGWAQTPPRPLAGRLDEIASPFQLGLMPGQAVAYLETYRGCPLSCRFCEWGASEAARAVFSADYLTRELEAYARQGVPAVFLVDAGLNLNAAGFRNLGQAEARVGFLKTTNFWCEVYPTFVRDEHLEFLSAIGPSYLGVGLQSLDSEVLRQHDRPFDQARFEAAVGQLSRVATVEVQIIFGLPSDTPDGFRRTLEYARSLPAAVRAYHCLVLPDALMTRGRPGWDMVYDPLTLEMISCQGWPPGRLAEMRAFMTQEARSAGGAAGNFWWFFPRRA